ncbi:hypothetical protein G6F61_014998 [Rhizopus arrhizus]|nr:hypothetical protein G6F61_014998 [Rhizopus arrhizus]
MFFPSSRWRPVHQLLPPRRLHPPLGARLRARGKPRRARRDGADPHQFAHVRRRQAPAVPGHRHRQRLSADRHERAL